MNFFRVFEKDENDDEFLTTEFHSLSNLLTNETEEIDVEITFPPHYRCVSHTLNLIAVKDSEKVLDNDFVYKKKYRMLCAKLSRLWSKQNQSTQVADKIKDICGVYLKTPVVTRY